MSFLLFMALFLLSPDSQARPAYMNQLSLYYRESKTPKTFQCHVCHGGNFLNPYGQDFRSKVLSNFNPTTRALRFDLIHELDSDGDRVSNLDEFKLGTNPGIKYQ